MIYIFKIHLNKVISSKKYILFSKRYLNNAKETIEKLYV